MPVILWHRNGEYKVGDISMVRGVRVLRMKEEQTKERTKKEKNERANKRIK
jgi:hypothetical protein